MNSVVALFWWMIPFGLFCFIFVSRFSWASRTMRRRRRSHYRVAAKAKRPMVTFMVRAR